MKTQITLGLSCLLTLGMLACGAGTGNDDAGGGFGGTLSGTGGAVGAGGSGGGSDAAPPPDSSGGGPEPYIYVVVQDTEQNACSSNGPGTDVDSVVLMTAAGTPLGYGLIGSAIYYPNPGGTACANTDCPSSNCKYSSISKTIPLTTLLPYTEGPPDGMVNAVGDDTGYFSLNAGTLQIQIGDLTGNGTPQAITSGQRILVYEIDQTYVTAKRAPATCVCSPEHYTVTLQTASGAALPLRAGSLSADNTTCDPLTLASTEGCGTTVFVVP